MRAGKLTPTASVLVEPGCSHKSGLTPAEFARLRLTDDADTPVNKTFFYESTIELIQTGIVEGNTIFEESREMFVDGFDGRARRFWPWELSFPTV